MLRIIKEGSRTPWGKADYVRMRTCPTTGVVIYTVSTPGHGGAYVQTADLHHIPEREQEYARRFSGSVNWYEEDVAYQSVILAFPDAFPEVGLDSKAGMRKSLDQWLARQD